MTRRYITAKEAAFALRTCADALEEFADDDLTVAKLVERVCDFVFATIGDGAEEIVDEIKEDELRRRKSPFSTAFGDAIADVDSGLDSIFDKDSWDDEDDEEEEDFDE